MAKEATFQEQPDRSWLESVSLVEELAANALPAALQQVVDGWRLRYGFGVTRRANSVLAAAHGGRYAPEHKLELAEAFYARWGRPARFQLCPASLPAGLDVLLEARGYTRSGPVHVQTAGVEGVAARAQTTAQHELELSETPSEAWLELYLATEGADRRTAELRRAIFARIPAPTAYVLARVAGQPAAVGLGVFERGHVGVFNVAAAPALRRRGAAGAVMGALAGWGLQRGATALYLQVAEGNAAALAFYKRLGFETLYRYHYREAP